MHSFLFGDLENIGVEFEKIQFIIDYFPMSSSMDNVSVGIEYQNVSVEVQIT